LIAAIFDAERFDIVVIVLGVAVTVIVGEPVVTGVIVTLGATVVVAPGNALSPSGTWPSCI